MTRSGWYSSITRSASTPFPAWATISTPPSCSSRKQQLVARQLLVVDDDRAQRPDGISGAISRAGGMRMSGITIRAQVPSPGTLSSCS